MQSLLSQFYLWTKRLAKGRFSQHFIFLSFFLDACVFPFPTTVIFITVSLLITSRSYYNALISTVAMVTGSIVGYAIGHYLWLLPTGEFTNFALYLFHHVPGFTEVNYHYIQNLALKWGYSILLFSTILPVPYQFYSITAGVFDFNLILFILLTLFFQGSRFLLIAWLTIKYGEGVKTILKKNLKIILLLCLIIISLILIFSLFGFLSP